MPYSAAAIANEFIDLADAQGEKLTHMKLQKLVFFAHGWHLALYGEPLLDEQVEAWKFGPVIRSLYLELREQGDRPVQEKIVKFRFSSRTGVPISKADWRDLVAKEHTPSADDDPANAAETRAFLKRVWDVYRPYTAIQLSNLTHAPGTPWDQVFNNYRGQVPKGTDIPADSIRDYFSTLAKQPPK
jgi:uncharacterized phage-associated protein